MKLPGFYLKCRLLITFVLTNNQKTEYFLFVENKKKENQQKRRYNI
jgi:hypothetical protein